MTKRNVIFSAIAVVAVLLIWIVSYFLVRNEYVLPSLWETFGAMGRLLGEASFWRAFGNTFLRTFLAFLLSFLCGVGLAIFAHLAGWLRAVFAPVVSILRTLPTMAIVLILLLWTSPAVAPVVVAALVLFPTAYAAALACLDEVGREYGELMRAFRVPLARKIVKMYLPLSAPVLLKQAGSLLSLGLKVVISGEVLASTFRSLGGMMQEAQIYLQTPRFMALVVVTVVLGFCLEGVCALVARALARWHS